MSDGNFQRLLIDDSLKPGKVICSIYGKSIYSNFISSLHSKIPKAKIKLIPYDWRKDLLHSAYSIKNSMTKYLAKYSFPLEIFIIGHSLGGLLVRIMLEIYDEAEFYKHVKCVFFVGAPLFGLHNFKNAFDESLLPLMLNTVVVNSKYSFFSKEQLLALCKQFRNNFVLLLPYNFFSATLINISSDIIDKYRWMAERLYNCDRWGAYGIYVVITNSYYPTISNFERNCVPNNSLPLDVRWPQIREENSLDRARSCFQWNFFDYGDGAVPIQDSCLNIAVKTKNTIQINDSSQLTHAFLLNSKFIKNNIIKLIIQKSIYP